MRVRPMLPSAACIRWAASQPSPKSARPCSISPGPISSAAPSCRWTAASAQAGESARFSMRDTKKTLFITGASAGLRHAFAEAALQAGHRVIGTVRREDDRVAFEAQHRTRANAVILDVSRFETVEAVVHKIEEDL